MQIRFNKKGQIVFLKRYTVKYGVLLFIFPKGFKSDGASIPWLFQLFVSPYEGDTLNAALVHDALYSAKGHFKIGKHEYHLTRVQTDRLFKRIMRSSHVPKWKYNAYWLAVRIGGWYPWVFHNQSKKRLSVVIK